MTSKISLSQVFICTNDILKTNIIIYVTINNINHELHFLFIKLTNTLTNQLSLSIKSCLVYINNSLLSNVF